VHAAVRLIYTLHEREEAEEHCKILGLKQWLKVLNYAELATKL